jgi:glutamyl-tRNA(Gln) amidotransferase subunit D
MHIKDFLKKNKASEGSLVEFDFETNKITGSIIPSYDDNLMIKLDSGYNAGFKTTKIKNFKVLGKSKVVSKAKVSKVKKDKNLPTISLLHTGGTIASRVNYQTGGVYASFDGDDIATMFPEILKIANIDSTLVSNMMSEDMGEEDYIKIAKAVAKEVKKETKGIIIGHGTDTLGYSAALLSFALKNLPLPVVLVGAQRSSDRGSSDAAMNLICATEFITKTNACGVFVCMHNSTNDDKCVILPGTNTRKMHTSRRDAFKSINRKPVALVNYKTREIKWVDNKENYKKSKEKFKLFDKFEKKVGLVKMHPGISEKIIDFYKKEKYKGLIIEGTGLGHTPVRKNDLFIKKIKELIDSGCVIGVTSQCINGRVHPSVYTNLRKLSSTGAIFCEDMIPETALMKLSFLLGNYSKKEAENLLAKNISGEISEFSRIDTYEE